MIEIKVGDYVETLDGMVGYVIGVMINTCSNLKTIAVQLQNGNTNHYNQVLNEEYEYEKHFKRIGEHDFLQERLDSYYDKIKLYCDLMDKIKDKNKIEPLRNMEFVGYNNKLFDCSMNQENVLDMWEKINEIIDYINKEDKVWQMIILYMHKYYY